MPVTLSIDRARIKAVRSLVRSEIAGLADELGSELEHLDLAAVGSYALFKREDFFDRRSKLDLSRWVRQGRFSGGRSPDEVCDRIRDVQHSELGDSECLAYLTSLWDRESAAKAIAKDRRPQYAYGLDLTTPQLDELGLTSDFLWHDWSDAADLVADVDEMLEDRARAEKASEPYEPELVPLDVLVSVDLEWLPTMAPTPILLAPPTAMPRPPEWADRYVPPKPLRAPLRHDETCRPIDTPIEPLGVLCVLCERNPVRRGAFGIRWALKRWIHGKSTRALRVTSARQFQQHG